MIFNYKNIKKATIQKYIYSIVSAAAAAQAAVIAETAFHRNKKNQNTTSSSSSSSSSDPLPRHSVNNLLEPFHTNILKMRLDKTSPANVTASQPNGGKSESLFDSSNYNPSSEMEKKRKMSPFLTVKPSTAICKDSDDVSYRDCSKQGKINMNWKQYHFAIAAKNSLDDTK